MFKNHNKSIGYLVGVGCGFIGIGLGSLLALYGVVLGHLYLKDGTNFVNNWQSLGLDVGIISAIIGIISSIYGIIINRFKY
ncbi:hypothetical protein [Commensalibacter papalotli (ex Servin-Garciduenas et al. 2014)]|uniref:Uncharacterized protein n=1 Tax=Commensalibacter papalotli (ex Servin-Garciduenas et al. 2014) TaxID=1208583 RepID=W7DMM8_9PROT|nr:hypothetical protein [Commensalibacter papalotli (ex Servin-Garciduenas et al. 2014)]EUK18577.1 hypothetical protein COMX_02475 [Commensalibacter papalotli (ex Servin-Garciduenas et al. 2014)]